MTRKERALKNLKQMCSDGRYLGSGSYVPLEILKDFEIAIKALEQWPTTKNEAKYCDRNICLKNEYNNVGCEDCEVTKSQEPTTQERQAESDKFDAAFQDGYDHGYAQARFDYEQEPTTKNDKVDCEHTDCKNCVNHKYCDYEPTTKNDSNKIPVKLHITEVKEHKSDFSDLEPTTKNDLAVDCISRQEVHNIFDCMGGTVEKIIDDLPSVTPQEPTTKDNSEVIAMLEILKAQAHNSGANTFIWDVTLESFNFVITRAIESLEQEPTTKNDLDIVMDAMQYRTNSLIENIKSEILHFANAHCSGDDISIYDVFKVIDDCCKAENLTTKNDLGVDCISRQDVLSEIIRFSTEEGSSVECQQLYCDVNNLPSVTPQEPRKGHWIKSEILNEKYICSECGGACWYYDYEGDVAKSNYCPNCGTDMREVKG